MPRPSGTSAGACSGWRARSCSGIAVARNGRSPITVSCGRTDVKLPSALIAGVLALCRCAHTAPTVPKVAEVDIPRFMGDWYVIAHIPSFPEREAYNAIESYSMREDGRIQTLFRYRRGSFDAPVRTMEPVGTVRAGTGNA